MLIHQFIDPWWALLQIIPEYGRQLRQCNKKKIYLKNWMELYSRAELNNVQFIESKYENIRFGSHTGTTPWENIMAQKHTIEDLEI